MLKLALSALETAINHYLQLDPDTTTALAKLHPNIIQLNITDWNLTLYCQPAPQGLNLFDHWDSPPNTVISGTLPSLLQVSLNQSDNKSLFENQVTISGDMQLGENMRLVMRHIDIDWELHLAKVVGNSLAVNIITAAEKAADFIKTKKSSFNEQLVNYIHHEQSLAVKPSEMRHFSDAVATLRHDIDRLTSTIARIQHKG